MCDLLLSRYGAAVNELPLAFGLELAAFVVKRERGAAAGDTHMPAPPRPLSKKPSEDILNHALDIRRKIYAREKSGAGE